MKKLVQTFLIAMLLSLTACSGNQKVVGWVTAIDANRMAFTVSVSEKSADDLTFFHNFASRYEYNSTFVNRRTGFSSLAVGQPVRVDYSNTGNVNVAVRVRILDSK